MEYVVITSGGKQYKVCPGDTIEVDNLNAEKDSSVDLSEVLLHVSDGKVTVGRPKVSGIIVKAKVIGDVKGKKIDVSTFKAKTRIRRTIGFRSSKTQLLIEAIVDSSRK
ncbi:MAG: 50S ribosomal protein L21 [Candidatus Levybacteria bacterium RIFCSPHIGHO2_12_FULL_38_12]|nr:MAG: 50S ribosomal protein L21 [Candidatus Levybacteria bacterium RIFCSPHIGHO2_01_FULL_38_12]OGH21838.1 MAG: 50S ribosomal protein L21 [Candidatus Levybacteria bacterium RIFCSPHIGHO2_02_FULL_37_18]OGH22505.1 MAG: 50S ribosomal protein L21 [Candidatus Levybacteria bacterium RIFCSPHIGHO2_12_FULL_38_12]OGH33459.1 MAG: 50S ribosomal protein L21 [Candidatus Levybacteria bacterium RIFCSPLOWO2_01_FULL_37_20]OGH44042.1 MAG: 50S ribosomal protein L21 [Candidatus Levybacteria bacterium RIFCSPLOWO2_02_